MHQNPRRRHSQLRPVLPGAVDGGHGGGALLRLHPGLPAAAGPAQAGPRGAEVRHPLPPLPVRGRAPVPALR